MSDIRTRKVTRAQIAESIGNNPRLIKLIEALTSDVGETLPAEVEAAAMMALQSYISPAVRPQPPSVDWQTLAIGQALAVNQPGQHSVDWQTVMAAGLLRSKSAAQSSSVSGVSLSAYNTWTANQRVAPVTLTDAATISTDALLSNNFRVVLGGNRVLANPTNLADGMTLNWVIVQDATGSRTLTFGSAFDWGGGAAPFLSTAAGAIDMVSAYYDATSGKLLASFRRGT